MEMNIKEFARVANFECWKLIVLNRHDGWTIEYQKDDSSPVFYVCTQRGTDRRVFSSLDTVYSVLQRHGFQGSFSVHVENQIAIF